MSARQSILNVIGQQNGWIADEVLTQLAFDGYRLLAPGQPDDFTREQAAKIGDAMAQKTRAMANDHARCNAFERRNLKLMAMAYIGIAAAIRAMGEKP